MTKRFKTGVKWLIWSAIITLTGAGGIFAYGWYQNRPPEPISVRIMQVKTGTIEDTINESGTVELGDQQTLKSPSESAVDKILVAPGDRIELGQPLIILRNFQRETILAKQKLEIQKQKLTIETNVQKIAEASEKLKIAQQNLNEFISKQNPQLLEIEKLEINLANNRKKSVEEAEKLAAEERKLTELQALLQRGFIAGNEVRSQEDSVRNARSILREAQFTVSTNIVEIQSLQLQRQQKKQELEEQLAPAASELRQAELELSRNERELQRLEVEYKEKQQEIKNDIVAAPITGKILDISVKNGDGVKLGDNLLTAGNPEEELVKLQLSTLNAGRVKPNQLARISVIGPNPKQFLGRVEKLSLQAVPSENQGNNRGQSGSAAVPATVKLNNPSSTLIPGSQVNIEIVLKQRENVVVLDTEAVVRSESKPFVWVRDSQGKAQKRLVTIGLEGLTQVEIISGLRSGDKVVIAPPEPPLKPGMPVEEEAKDKPKEES
ncbi:MAG: efflux RND transporter periplasmic adaptor subunit [Oscillatoriaceae cyanobacterium Prado104]|jgi:HlyD family secretion protein|nr:efflux RND transporter periplasmic adaptor subunit [Oscillatoriaceae cyanobacterium Prado104]